MLILALTIYGQLGKFIDIETACLCGNHQEEIHMGCLPGWNDIRLNDALLLICRLIHAATKYYKKNCNHL